ncbi:uncharacterized protein NP_3744A [Natronomonas pharaonis DSM 2160]|uniref:Uncharacterized protein n=1 Tax=Natronomonas pharaonis (strain ATCC 35678 / DSM 2160 / CIP 103997 / JCM 8858 / NBRC 14720 / NCIMB 2260 / Gabara) TaxID=348780 RepID=A0A1U7EXP6_NATPD|nr:hypothetical protein [Natronomonas pharaonis]CAI49963.1 uncharacterized protein NP_3744A [Natronomonas pharaonis DSM 2160]
MVRLVAAARSPWAYIGLWLPVVTVVAFLLADFVGVVAVPSAVLAVTLAAALGWVVVGVGGSRTDPEFALRARGEQQPAAKANGRDSDRPLGTAVLVYLTATTGLGWLAVVTVV